jgi:hypothetical protein
VVVVVELIVQVVDSSSTADEIAASTWVAGIGPIVGDSTDLAPVVSTVRADGATVSRVALERDLGRIVAGSQRVVDELRALGLGPPNDAMGELFEDVVEERAKAAMLLTGGVELAIGSGSEQTATNELVQAAQLMTLSDVDYARLVSLIPASEGSASLPSSRWVVDYAPWSVTALTSWVSTLRATTSLQLDQALSLVAVSLQPPVLRVTGLPPTTTTSSTTSSTTTTTTTTTSTTTSTLPGQTGATTTSSSTSTTSTSTTTTTVPPTTTTLQTLPSGAVSVVPPTTTLSVIVVLANSGNVPLASVVVTATLAPDVSDTASIASGSGSRTTRSVLRGLGSGRSSYLVLPTLAVTDGASYRLTVTASAAGVGGASVTAGESFVVTVAG